MKKRDFIFIGCVILFFLPFFIFDPVYEKYNAFHTEHGMIMSALKFAVLASLGEVIGLRISKGVYNEKGFGILPRAVVWAFLGMGIKMAMDIFYAGTPVFLSKMGFTNAVEIIGLKELTFSKVLIAFSISAAMNTIFAPVFMTLHKITDRHILQGGGTLKALFRPVNMAQSLKNLNWDVQWNFVFKKTIPLFWFPAHTITFLLPGNYRVLFAALLGVVLGLILSAASMRRK